VRISNYFLNHDKTNRIDDRYGYYPDHSKETVTATRSGTSLTVNIAAGGKTGSFRATIALPTTGTKPYPVLITTSFTPSAPYTKLGIAVVTYDTGSVAADSRSKTGAFWSLYNGQDSGTFSHVLSDDQLMQMGI
jgi:hypothetical protein